MIIKKSAIYGIYFIEVYVLKLNILVFLFRQQKLQESLTYQEFSARLSEEELWLAEKLSLSQSEDYGNSLAAVQVREQ